MMLAFVSAVVLAAAPLAAAAPGTASSFTLEQVLSAPFPTGLIAARGHAKVAWIFNAKGVRNVWVAAGPDYVGRPVTSFTEDDGEEIGDLAFTADARAVVFVRGGAPNRAAEIPNPLSRPEPRERAIYLATVDGPAAGSPRKLATGDSPLPQPGQARLVFLDKNQVFGLDLAEGAKPERIFAARGGLGSLRFSRDGKQLAFVSDRGDHAYVGVYDFEARAIRWMDPGVDRDGEPVFSPDGRSLAFLRIPAVKPVLFVPEREGEPWSIRVAEVGTGKGREVFRADKGTGSVFRGAVADNQILWAGDRLVFPWEKTGWLHLYAVPAAGGTATALTQGCVRGRVRHRRPPRDHGRLQLERGRHRPTPHLGGARRGGYAGAPHHEPGHSVGPRHHQRRGPRLPPFVGGAAGAAHPEDRRRRRLTRSRPRRDPRRLPREGTRRARGRDGHGERRHAHPRPALQAQGVEAR